MLRHTTVRTPPLFLKRWLIPSQEGKRHARRPHSTTTRSFPSHIAFFCPRPRPDRTEKHTRLYYVGIRQDPFFWIFRLTHCFDVLECGSPTLTLRSGSPSLRNGGGGAPLTQRSRSFLPHSLPQLSSSCDQSFLSRSHSLALPLHRGC